MFMSILSLLTISAVYGLNLPLKDDYQCDFTAYQTGWKIYDAKYLNYDLCEPFVSQYTGNIYYGPFEGNKVFLQRDFMCPSDSSLSTEWKVAHCGIDKSKENSALFFNEELIQSYSLANVMQNTDPKLVELTGCKSFYTQEFVELVVTPIESQTMFNLNYRVKTNALGEYAFVYDIEITCNPSALSTTTTTTTTTTPAPITTTNDFSHISLDLSQYDYDGIFPEIPFCNQLEDHFERSTANSQCDGERIDVGFGSACYPRCRSGYMDQILTGGVGCVEICGNGWVQVDQLCTKTTPFACGCTRTCIPFTNICDTVCPLPCVETKTVDHYWRDIQVEICPINFDSIAETFQCLSQCGDGYLPGENILQCVCDITDTLNQFRFISAFLNDIKSQLSSGLDLLTGVLSPILFSMTPDQLYLIFYSHTRALDLMSPYLNDITNFLAVATSSRRRLGWNGNDIVGSLEITVSGHAGSPFVGPPRGIGFAIHNGGVEFYMTGCTQRYYDREGSISLGVTFYQNIDSVSGDSIVFGRGGDIPIGLELFGAELYFILSSEMDDVIGCGFSVGVGIGLAPREGNLHYCSTTDTWLINLQ